MSHALDMSNGRANIAYIGETPWHGMGTLMPADMPVHEWVEAAGMGWQAIKVPAGFKVGNDWREEPGQWAIIRDDTFQRLGQFTDRYKIVQPAQVIEFFRDFILTDERFTMETAGCLKNGAVVWGMAKFADNLKVLGEDHTPYVMLSTSYDGSLATTAQATMIRVVCKNTMQASLFSEKSATVKVRHSTIWNEPAAAKAHDQLATIAASYDDFKVMAEGLGRQKMARQQTVDFFVKLTGAEADEGAKVSTRKANMVEALMASLATTEDEGTVKGTAWTVFNAVTRYVDHDRATRRTNGESEDSSRMNSRFFGSGAAMKAQALEMLQAA